MLTLITAIWGSSIALHDPRCNPALNVQVCVDREIDTRGRRILRCVDSRAENPLFTDVVWHKNGVLTESTRVHKEGAGDRLIFEELLVSDEGQLDLF